jgi:hypothetical protein
MNEHGVDASGHEIDHRGRAPAIRHVQQVHFRGELQKLAGEMEVAADARRRERDRARLAASHRDELLHVRRRHRRMRDEHEIISAHLYHRREKLERIPRRRCVELRAHGDERAGL